MLKPCPPTDLANATLQASRGWRNPVGQRVHHLVGGSHTHDGMCCLSCGATQATSDFMPCYAGLRGLDSISSVCSLRTDLGSEASPVGERLVHRGHHDRAITDC